MGTAHTFTQEQLAQELERVRREERQRWEAEAQKKEKEDNDNALLWLASNPEWAKFFQSTIGATPEELSDGGCVRRLREQAVRHVLSTPQQQRPIEEKPMRPVPPVPLVELKMPGRPAPPAPSTPVANPAPVTTIETAPMTTVISSDAPPPPPPPPPPPLPTSTTATQGRLLQAPVGDIASQINSFTFLPKREVVEIASPSKTDDALVALLKNAVASHRKSMRFSTNDTCENSDEDFSEWDPN